MSPGRYKTIIFLVVVFIGLIYFSRTMSPSKPFDPANDSLLKQAEKITNSFRNTPNAANSESVSEPKPIQVKITHEEKLRRWGFVDDPDDSLRMKKEILENGKKKTIYANKNEESTEPTERTKKAAEEALASKLQQNPAEELLELKPLDESNDDQSMLFSTFRDDDNQIEAAISISTDENGTYLNQDFACLMSPSRNLNFKSAHGKYIVRGDQAGYAVVKFDETTYLRATWSMEDGDRLAHLQLLKIENGIPTVKLSFVGKPVSKLKGETVYWCN